MCEQEQGLRLLWQEGRSGMAQEEMRPSPDPLSGHRVPRIGGTQLHDDSPQDEQRGQSGQGSHYALRLRRHLYLCGA